MRDQDRGAGKRKSGREGTNHTDAEARPSDGAPGRTNHTLSHPLLKGPIALALALWQRVTAGTLRWIHRHSGSVCMVSCCVATRGAWQVAQKIRSVRPRSSGAVNLDERCHHSPLIR